MELISFLETLEETIERSSSLPLTGKCIVDRVEILELIKDIRRKLPDEIKQAKWVKEERHRILMEAQKEADNIIKDTEGKIMSLIDEHEVTRKAYEQANEIISNAQKTAREIRLGTKEYADGILMKVEEMLRENLDIIKENREELK